ncbi:secreted frizzled-related protein 5-like isoform X1 [Prionailurus iriomotensis]
MGRCPATVESLAVPLHWDGTGAPAQGLIYPCRSLCEALQASCAPIMACYGYPWPAILHCGRFPAGHSLWVAAVSVGSRLGRPCESPRGPQAMSTGSAPPFQAAPRRARKVPRASCRDCELQDARSSNEVLEALCASDFGEPIPSVQYSLHPPYKCLHPSYQLGVKVWLSRCNGSSFGLSDCNLDSGLEVLKAGPLPAVELAPILRRWLQLDATCMHNLLRGRHAETYVLSGEVQGHRLLVTTAYAWSQGHRNLQLEVRRWHHHQCPE